MIYEKELAMVGKDYKVITDWKIGTTKQKIGDILTVIGYGSGNACNYLVFNNKRLSGYKFTTGTWLFTKNVINI